MKAKPPARLDPHVPGEGGDGLPFRTHDVRNQPPPRENVNLFLTDLPLQEALEREGAGWAKPALTAFGEQLGRAATLQLGALANRYPPVLHTHDRYGNRRDEVEFHPAWHALMSLTAAQGVHSAPWADPRPGAHVARAAACVLHAQVENGTQCPLTMTYAAIPVVRRQAAVTPWLREQWLPRLLAPAYDQTFAPIEQKSAALIGMGMTEKQGGSDVRANTTRAEPSGPRGSGQEYRLTGHKWFLSAPMCDAFLVLAQAQDGISCFFVPRFLPDGTRNAILIQRLKDKLGNKSNASSEVEFAGAFGLLLGDEGRGVPTILEMGTYTRLDCAIGSTGLMRAALAEAVHHAGHREAFGRRLGEQPLMRNVLADLALEVEAATALTMRLARAFDQQDDESEAALRRLLTPAVKYWVCKRGPVLAAEAMEVLGGSGYVEESALPRIYRELPVNSIWEGSGNVMCLDVLRAMQKSPQAMQMVEAELDVARGGDRRLDRFMAALRVALEDATDREARARRLTEDLALAMQGSLLVRYAPPPVADAFCGSRLDVDRHGTFGTLPATTHFGALIERAAGVG
jgi:putative acyl-CoA dehydrogenase